MFERFTDEARRVLVLAQEEARDLQHDFIGTEHLLLGILHHGTGPAPEALTAAGVTLEAARARIGELVGPAGSPLQRPAPFTPRAKKTLELALREALQLGHDHIATEHLLLGIIREGEGVGARTIEDLGADLASVREAVIARIKPADAPTAAPAPPPAGRVWRGGRRTRTQPVGDPPRCPSCGAPLGETARYRLLDVPPAEGGESGKASGKALISVTVVYCVRCGTALGPA